MRKKYNTEEERIEGRRRTQREADKRYREKMNNVFIVYKHTNDKGDVYIGSGNYKRPYDNSLLSRYETHFNAFNGSPNIEIISRFKCKEIARAYESYLIAQMGIDNLINERQPTFKLTFPKRT